VTEEQLSNESSDGEVLCEQNLGSKSDVPTELVPLVSSELESFDQTLRYRNKPSRRLLEDVRDLLESRDEKEGNDQLTR